MNKLIGLTLLIFAGCALIPGCGSSGHTRKLKSMATEYVKEKYGIKAKAGRVSNDGISWLTPIWEKSKAGIVEMKYDGREFYVHADLELGADQCTDNYLEDEFCDRIVSCFQDIHCDEKDFAVAYTEGHYKHLVGKDVKTFDDLIADERIPGIFVYIYTYGLDTDSLNSVDLSDASWLSTASIYDWTESSMVRSEYKPVTSPYTEQFVLKSYSEYTATFAPTGAAPAISMVILIGVDTGNSIKTSTVTRGMTRRRTVLTRYRRFVVKRAPIFVLAR